MAELRAGPVVARHMPKRDELARWANTMLPDNSEHKTMPGTLASDLADGHLLARMMMQWGMMTRANFKKFRQGSSNDVILHNYKMLEPIFRILQLNITPGKAAKLIKADQKAAVELLCNLKFMFEGRPARGPNFNQDFVRQRKREAGEDGDAHVGDVKSLDWMRELCEHIPPTHQEALHDRIQRPYQAKRLSGEASYLTLPGVFDHLSEKQRQQQMERCIGPAASSNTGSLASTGQLSRAANDGRESHDQNMWLDSDVLSSQSLSALDNMAAGQPHAPKDGTRTNRAAGGRLPKMPSQEGHSWIGEAPRRLTLEETEILRRQLREKGSVQVPGARVFPLGKLRGSRGPVPGTPPVGVTELPRVIYDDAEALVSHSTPTLDSEGTAAQGRRFRGYGARAMQFTKETLLILDQSETRVGSDKRTEDEERGETEVDGDPTSFPQAQEVEVTTVNVACPPISDKDWVESVAAAADQKWEALVGQWYEHDEPDDLGPARGSVLDVDIDKIRQRLGPAPSVPRTLPPSKNLQARRQEKALLDGCLERHREWMLKVKRGEVKPLPKADDAHFYNQNAVLELDAYDASGGLAAGLQQIEEDLRIEWAKRPSHAGPLKKALLNGREHFSEFEAAMPANAVEEYLSSLPRADRVRRQLETEKFRESHPFIHPHLARQDHRFTMSPLTSEQIDQLNAPPSSDLGNMVLFDLPTRPCKQLLISLQQYDYDNMCKLQRGLRELWTKEHHPAGQTRNHGDEQAGEGGDVIDDIIEVHVALPAGSHSPATAGSGEGSCADDETNIFARPVYAERGQNGAPATGIETVSEQISVPAHGPATSEFSQPMCLHNSNKADKENNVTMAEITVTAPSDVQLPASTDILAATAEPAFAEGEVGDAIDRSNAELQTEQSGPNEVSIESAVGSDPKSKVKIRDMGLKPPSDDLIRKTILLRMAEMEFDAEKRAGVSKKLRPYRHPMPLAMRRDFDSLERSTAEWSESYTTSIRHAKQERERGKQESIKNRRWMLAGVQKLVKRKVDAALLQGVQERWASQQRCAAEVRIENRLEETAFDIMSSVIQLNKLQAEYRIKFREEQLAEKEAHRQAELNAEKEQFTRRVNTEVSILQGYGKNMVKERSDAVLAWASTLTREIVDVAIRQSELLSLTVKEVPPELLDQVKAKFVAGVPMYPHCTPNARGWERPTPDAIGQGVALADRVVGDHDLNLYQNYLGKWTVKPPAAAQGKPSVSPDIQFQEVTVGKASPRAEKRPATPPAQPSAAAAALATSTSFLGTPPPNYALANLLVNLEDRSRASHAEEPLCNYSLESAEELLESSSITGRSDLSPVPATAASAEGSLSPSRQDTLSQTLAADSKSQQPLVESRSPSAAASEAPMPANPPSQAKEPSKVGGYLPAAKGKPLLHRHKVRGVVIGKPFAGKTALLRQLRRDYPVQIITEDYLIRNAIDEYHAQKEELATVYESLQRKKEQWDKEVEMKKEVMEAERKKTEELKREEAERQAERPAQADGSAGEAASNSSLKKHVSKDQTSTSSIKSRASAAKSKSRLSAVDRAAVTSKASIASVTEDGRSSTLSGNADAGSVSQVCARSGATTLPPNPQLEVVVPDFSGSWLIFSPMAMIGWHVLQNLQYGERLNDVDLMVLLELELMQIPADCGWILDGMPQTLRQAQMLVGVLSGFKSAPLQDGEAAAELLHFIPKSPLEHVRRKPSKLLPEMETGGYHQLVECGLDFVIHLDTPDDICSRRAHAHYYRESIRKNPEMMKAPFWPHVPDELLPLPDEDVRILARLHQGMRQYGKHFANVVNFFSMFGVVSTISGAVATGDNVDLIVNGLKLMDGQRRYKTLSNSELMKRHRDIAEHVKLQRHVRTKDYRNFTALRKPLEKQKAELLEMMNADPDYDVAEWDGYLHPRSGPGELNEKVSKSYQRLLAKADPANGLYRFALAFFLDEEAASSLLDVWRKMEKHYLKIMNTALKDLRIEQERILKTIHSARDSLTAQSALLESEEPLRFSLPSIQHVLNQLIVKARKGNWSKDLLSSVVTGVEGDLLRMVQESNDAFSDAVNKHRTWAFLEDQRGMISNTFILMMEAELLRYRTTCNIIQDYYCIIEGRTAEKHKIENFDFLKFLKIPRVQRFVNIVPPSVMPPVKLPKDKKKDEEKATGSSAAANVLPSEEASKRTVPDADAEKEKEERGKTPSQLVKDKKKAGRESPKKADADKGKGSKSSAKGSAKSKPSAAKKGGEKSAAPSRAEIAEEPQAASNQKDGQSAAATEPKEEKLKVEVKFIKKHGQYYEAESAALDGTAPNLDLVEESSSAKDQLAATVAAAAAAATAAVATELQQPTATSRPDDEAMLLDMYSTAMNQITDMHKRVQEPFKRSVLPPEPVDKQETMEAEAKAIIAGKKKGGKDAKPDKKKPPAKGKKADPTPEPPIEVPTRVSLEEEVHLLKMKRIEKVRREGLFVAALERMHCEARLKLLRDNATASMVGLKADLEDIYCEILTKSTTRNTVKAEQMQQVIGKFRAAIELDSPVLYRMEYHHERVELDMTYILPYPRKCEESIAFTERPLDQVPSTYDLVLFVHDLLNHQKTFQVAVDTMDKLERSVNCTKLPDPTITTDYDWRRRAMLFLIERSSSLPVSDLLRLTRLLKAADCHKKQLLTKKVFINRMGSWLRTSRAGTIPNPHLDKRRYSFITQHLCRYFSNSDGMVNYMSAVFFLCAAETPLKGFMNAVAVANIEHVEKSDISHGMVRLDAVNQVLMDDNLNLFRHGGSMARMLTTELFQGQKKKSGQSLPDVITKPYNDFLERQKKTFPDKYELIPTVVPLDKVLDHQVVRDFIATCPVLKLQGFKQE